MKKRRLTPRRASRELYKGCDTAFSSDDVFDALEHLAAEKNMSMSAMAKAAGLDASLLNYSRRNKADGTARWLSTETISLILAATNITPAKFAKILQIEAKKNPPKRV